MDKLKYSLIIVIGLPCSGNKQLYKYNVKFVSG